MSSSKMEAYDRLLDEADAQGGEDIHDLGLAPQEMVLEDRGAVRGVDGVQGFEQAVVARHEHVLVTQGGAHGPHQRRGEKGHVAGEDEGVAGFQAGQGGVDAGQWPQARVDVRHHGQAQMGVPVRGVGDEQRLLAKEVPQAQAHVGKQGPPAEGDAGLVAAHAPAFAAGQDHGSHVLRCAVSHGGLLRLRPWRPGYSLTAFFMQATTLVASLHWRT